MAQATSIPISKFTHAVQAAVKAATAKNPNFAGDPPQGLVFWYHINGIYLNEAILAKVTLQEAQKFSNEVASHIAGSIPELKSVAGQGTCLIIGGHHIIGIPPVEQGFRFEG